MVKSPNTNPEGKLFFLPDAPASQFNWIPRTRNRYVERTKEIVNTVAVNEADANPLVGKLKDEVRALQEMLEQKEAAIVEHEVKKKLKISWAAILHASIYF